MASPINVKSISSIDSSFIDFHRPFSSRYKMRHSLAERWNSRDKRKHASGYQRLWCFPPKFFHLSHGVLFIWPPMGTWGTARTSAWWLKGPGWRWWSLHFREQFLRFLDCRCPASRGISPYLRGPLCLPANDYAWHPIWVSAYRWVHEHSLWVDKRATKKLFFTRNACVTFIGVSAW